MDTFPLDKVLSAATGHRTPATAVLSRDLTEVRPGVDRFDDAGREYASLQQGAGLVDLSDGCQIEVTGADAARFLHNFCTNDIERLGPGDGCEAFATNVKGRVVSHMFVYARHDATGFDIESAPHAERVLLPHWDRFLFNDDVHIIDRSKNFGQLMVVGPQSLAVLRAAGLAIPLDSERCRQSEISREGTALQVRHHTALGYPCWSLVADHARLPEVWKRLVDAGAQPVGAQAYHALRIEAGFALAGIDLGDHLLAQEANRTAQAISFTKGCYLGQEPIARLDSVGHLNRQLQTVQFTASRLPEAGDEIVDPASSRQGQITSCVRHPVNDGYVALALLRI